MSGLATSPIRSVLLVASSIAAISCQPAGAQDFSGRWTYEESGQTAELDIRHDQATGEISGTLALFGKRVAVEGQATAGSLVIASVGAAEAGTLRGRLDGGALLLTVAQPEGEPVTLRMTRSGGTTMADEAPDRLGGAEGRQDSQGAPSPERSSPAGTRDFVGRWEATSDDGTEQELVELTASGNTVSGTVTSLERGYYSGRVTVKQQAMVRGTLRGGKLDLKVWDAQGAAENGVSGTGYRRGEYLVLQIGEGETGYARPGTPLVRSAEGSPEAAALRRAITGRVYSASAQAGGRGAFVGGRVRLALCADGRIEYDASDVAATAGALPDGGVDLGSTVTRRGTWTVVLLAGAPAVRANWQGTGSTYTLTAYFHIRPSADGRTAVVDGVELPVTGSC